VAVDNTTKIIIIEPASPQIVYVPTYDPVVVYGVWRTRPTLRIPSTRPPRRCIFRRGRGRRRVGYAWGHSNWHGATWTSTSIGTRISTRTSTGEIRATATRRAHPAGKMAA